jgi:hypothetical protein
VSSAHTERLARSHSSFRAVGLDSSFAQEAIVVRPDGKNFPCLKTVKFNTINFTKDVAVDAKQYAPRSGRGAIHRPQWRLFLAGITCSLFATMATLKFLERESLGDKIVKLEGNPTYATPLPSETPVADPRVIPLLAGGGFALAVFSYGSLVRASR